MANVGAIHSVGNSIAIYLTRTYPADLRARHPCTFAVISSGTIQDFKPDENTNVTLFLYQVTLNEHTRNASQFPGLADHQVPLLVDLHYLLTVWSKSALAEQVVLGWTMRQLFLRPILDRSVLTSEAGWDSSDSVQVVAAELSNEALMRIWDALTPPYHLTVAYVARVVQIDPDREPDSLPAVARRLAFGNVEDQP